MDEFLNPNEIHKLLKESGSVGFRQANDPFFKPINKLMHKKYRKGGVFYLEKKDSDQKK